MQLEVAKAVTDDIICEVESLLRDGLSGVVEQEMKAVYEHMWCVRILYVCKSAVEKFARLFRITVD